MTYRQIKWMISSMWYHQSQSKIKVYPSKNFKFTPYVDLKISGSSTLGRDWRNKADRKKAKGKELITYLFLILLETVA